MKRNQTTNGDGSEAGKSDGGSGLVSACAREDGIADAEALLIHMVEDAARPDELRCQETEPESDRELPGPGGDEHDDTQSKQREPKEDLQEALGLLECLKEHRLNPSQATSSTTTAIQLLRCGSTGPGCK